MSDGFLQGDIRPPDEKPKDCLDSEMTSLRGTGGASLVTPAGALAVYKELCSTFVDDTVHSNLWLLDLFCPSTFILTPEIMHLHSLWDHLNTFPSVQVFSLRRHFGFMLIIFCFLVQIH